MGQWQVSTDRPRAVEPKNLFQTILKIDVTYGKHARLSGRLRRGEDTQAISESSLPSQEVYLFLKQNQNTEQNRLQNTIRQGDHCNIARLDTKTHGTCVLWGMDVWNCLCSAVIAKCTNVHGNTKQIQSLSTEQPFSFQTIQEQMALKAMGLLIKTCLPLFFRSFILRGRDFQCHQSHHTQPYLVTSQWTTRNKQEDKIAH